MRLKQKANKMTINKFALTKESLSALSLKSQKIGTSFLNKLGSLRSVVWERIEQP